MCKRPCSPPPLLFSPRRRPHLWQLDAHVVVPQEDLGARVIDPQRGHGTVTGRVPPATLVVVFDREANTPRHYHPKKGTYPKLFPLGAEAV